MFALSFVSASVAIVGGGLDAPSGGEDRVVAGSSPDDSRSLPTTLLPLSAMII